MTVPKSDLICDLIDIIGEAKKPRCPKWRFKINGMGLDLKRTTKWPGPRIAESAAGAAPTEQEPMK